MADEITIEYDQVIQMFQLTVLGEVLPIRKRYEKLHKCLQWSNIFTISRKYEYNKQREIYVPTVHA